MVSNTANGNYIEKPFKKFKLQNKLTNPMSLQIYREQTTDNQAREYTLVGFIWHIGSIEGAHYKADVKQEGMWKCYNDSVVTKITVEEAAARAQEAYLFFYYQINQPTGGS